jgi:cobyrinic acid a,c-diamide synthase
MQIPRLVIAGTHSGVGKTTVTAGLLAAFKARGLTVQPFKCGPDYIDPTYHAFAAGIPCRNLDSWILPKPTMVELFQRAAGQGDLSLIEGVMGLYDGRGGLEEEGSTAEIAKLLQAPVLLVLDVGKTSRSSAAQVLGYQAFDPDLSLAGVIINQVGSERHMRWVKEAIEELVGVPVVGYLPKRSEIEIPERHLGLIPAVEGGSLPPAVEKIRRVVEETVDIETVLQLARSAPPIPEAVVGLFPMESLPVQAVIGLAHDEAFHFYYQDSLDLLTAWGARLVPLSPLRDSHLPSGIQGLYIGGGFPEVFAKELSANSAFRQSVTQAASAGMPIYGECGGLMYLSEGIVDFDGDRHPMVGLIEGWSAMQRKRVRMGYAVAETLQETILAPQGYKVRGHEFHWSEMAEPEEGTAYRVEGPPERREGFVRGPRGNILGSYLHLHFGADVTLAQRFIQRCALWKG